MKVSRTYFAVLVSLILAVAASTASALTCDTLNGTRFNLESRVNAVPQNTESMDFMLNRVAPGVDLVVGAANDKRGDFNTAPGFPTDLGRAVYYVHRTGANCAADFEGSLALFSLPLGPPTVVADHARDAFFLSDVLPSLSQIVEVGRTTATKLLSTTACPNGTHSVSQSLTCWPVTGLADFTNPNPNIQAFLGHPHIAVDARSSGTGAGDLYVAAEYHNVSNFPSISNIQIITCTNATVSCGAPVVVSGTDTFGSFPYIQVRHDGVITLSYWTFTKPNDGSQPNPIAIRFVTCTPQGAPMPPVCSTPTRVAISNVPARFAPAANGFTDVLFPKHVNRLEADGKTTTTFLIYDRCRSIVGNATFGAPACSKVDVVYVTSTNNGATWTFPHSVSLAAGHQYMGAIGIDKSTNITSIAYYSAQEDPFRQRAHVLLRQIAAGSTILGPTHALTLSNNDPSSGIGDLTEPGGAGVVDFGDRIGIAAAGTGTPGQSRVYVHYTWNNVAGISNGISQPDANNTLVPFSY
jgi:hypothetical protein